MKNHPLFPNHPECDITGIHVTRQESGGKVWSAERYEPDRLLELSHILELYGGGLFELVAHGTNEKGKGGICARQEYRLDGAPKPLNPSAAAPAAAPVASLPTNGHASGSDSLIGILLQQAGEDRRAMMALMAKMSERPPAPPPTPPDNSVLVALIKNQGDMMQAMLTKPAPAAGAASDPIKLVLDVLEVGNNLRAGAAEAISKAGNAGQVDLPGLVDAAERVVKVVQKAKDLADKGVSPDAAAALLNEEAAAAGV